MLSITIPEGRRSHLLSLSPAQARKLRRDSVKALRTAWPHRRSFRGNIVVRANVRMLRDLDLLGI